MAEPDGSSVGGSQRGGRNRGRSPSHSFCELPFRGNDRHPARELLGFDPSLFYSSQEWDFVTRQIDNAFRQGRHPFQFVLPRKSGGRIPVIISYKAVENLGKRFRIITFTDISEQVWGDEKLRCANAQLSNAKWKSKKTCD